MFRENKMLKKELEDSKINERYCLRNSEVDETDYMVFGCPPHCGKSLWLKKQIRRFEKEGRNFIVVDNDKLEGMMRKNNELMMLNRILWEFILNGQ